MKNVIIATILVLLLITILILPPGCKEETVVPAHSASQENRWLKLLITLPANENTLKAAYLQDTTYFKEKRQRYSEISVEYEYALSLNLPSLLGGTPNRYNDEE